MKIQKIYNYEETMKDKENIVEIEYIDQITIMRKNGEVIAHIFVDDDKQLRSIIENGLKCVVNGIIL